MLCKDRWVSQGTIVLSKSVYLFMTFENKVISLWFSFLPFSPCPSHPVPPTLEPPHSSFTSSSRAPGSVCPHPDPTSSPTKITLSHSLKTVHTHTHTHNSGYSLALHILPDSPFWHGIKHLFFLECDICCLVTLPWLPVYSSSDEWFWLGSNVIGA